MLLLNFPNDPVKIRFMSNPGYVTRSISNILQLFMKVQFLQAPGLGEGPEAAVVGLLDIIGETAGRQLFR